VPVWKEEVDYSVNVMLYLPTNEHQQQHWSV